MFTGEDVFKKVGDLSGGEKGRLALAKLIYSNFNVLILDEPTNHLDIPSRESLEAALEEYAGTIITVSHDRFFLDKITTQILSFEDDGKAIVFNGDYTEFHDAQNQKASVKTEENSKNKASEIETQSVSGENQTNANLSKNQLRQIEKRIAEIEKEIPIAEEDLQKQTLKIAAPEIAADHAKLNAATEKLQTTEKKIQQLYAEWEDLLEQLRG